MSANKSQNLKLHLWEPEDNFLRAEFNENFAAIDEALETKVNNRRLEEREAMDALTYNVHHMAAQLNYHYPFVGGRRRLFLNTFRCEEQRQGLSNLLWDGLHMLMLGPQTQITREQFYPCAPTSEMKSGYTTSGGLYGPCSMVITMREIPAHLTGVGVYLHMKQSTPETLTTTITAKLYRMDGNTKTLIKTMDVNTIFSRYISNNSYTKTNLPVDFLLNARTKYTLEVFAPSSDLHSMVTFYESLNNCHFSPTVGELVFYQGTVTDTDRWDGPVSRAVGLIRYQNGTVNLSINGQNMTRRTTRSTVNCLGEPCTEAEFVLDNPGSGNMTFKLSASCGMGSNMNVYDYGVYALR